MSIKHTETRFAGRYSKEVFSTLWMAYKAQIFLLLPLLLFGVIGRLLLLANANVVGIWVDSICHSSVNVHCRPVPDFFASFDQSDFVQFLTIITLTGFLFSLVFRIGFSVVSAKAVSRLHDETVLRTSRYPMSFFDGNPTGRIVTRFSTDYGNVFRLFGGPLAEFLSIIFDLLSMIVLIGFASPFYLLAIALITSLNFIVYRVNRNRLRTYRRELSLSRSPSIAHFSETTQGASTIRSFNREATFTERFARLDQNYLTKKLKVLQNILFFGLQMNSLTALLLIVTGLLAYFMLQTGQVSVGSLGVAFGFIALSGGTVQNFFEWLAQFEDAMIGIERLNQYLRLPIEDGAKLPVHTRFKTQHWQKSVNETSPLWSHNQSAAVEFKSVSFRYAKELPFILKNISFAIQPGEKFGIVGRTGSGKSSLVQALFHLYPIEQGKISILGLHPQMHQDSAEKNAIDLEEFRKQVSFISQESILFQGSLRQNLIAQLDQDDEMLIQVLKRVGLTQWANQTGLDLEIEEKGKNLSLGEKQLICMARCLLTNNPIVIMDEATSSVDPKSEEIMVRATNELFADKTQIIIAHRLSTLLRCDRILWLQDGEIKLVGKPEQVLNQFRAADLTV